MQAALVGECAGAHEGLRVDRRHVSDLSHVQGHLRQSLELIVGYAVDAQLQLQIGDDGDQVRVAAALAVAVDRALNVGGARLRRRQCSGDRRVRVVVRVYTEPHVRLPADRGNGLADLFRQGPAVGVAQDDALGAGARGRPHGLQSVGRVGLEAVEEVLGIEEHSAAVGLQIGDRVRYHRQILFQGRLQHPGNVQVPAFPHQGGDAGAALQQRPDVGVVLHGEARIARAAEGGDGGVGKLRLPDAPEVVGVLGVGARPTPLDVVDSQLVQPACDGELVLDRKRDALELGAVAQRRVVKLDLRHSSSSLGARGRPRTQKDPPLRGRDLARGTTQLPGGAARPLRLAAIPGAPLGYVFIPSPC